MIGTLFAQEFRTTRKNLLQAIGVFVLVLVVSLAMAALGIPVLGSIGMVLGIATAVAITPIALVVLAESYWRTMYGREGYFTMSLPVAGRTLFGVKVLYGIVAAAGGLVLTAAGLLAAGAANALMIGQSPAEFLRAGLQLVQPWQAWLAPLALLLQLVFLVVVGAGIMSVGAQARFNHLGFGAPMIGGVIAYLVMQVVTFAAIMFVPVGLVVAGPDAGTLVSRGMYDEIVAAIAHAGGDGSPVTVLGLGFVVTSLAAIVLMAWWGASSVEKHTSLR